MPSQKSANNNTAWATRDELFFVSNIGRFSSSRTPSLATVQTLLFRYRDALQARELCSFDKNEVLLLVNRRLQEIHQKRQVAVKSACGERLASHAP